MTKKLKKRKSQSKKYEKNIKKVVDGGKPLGRPIPNKFLLWIVKDEIMNHN